VKPRHLPLAALEAARELVLALDAVVACNGDELYVRCKDRGVAQLIAQKTS